MSEDCTPGLIEDANAQFERDLTDAIRRALMREEVQSTMTRVIAQDLRRHMGGAHVYIPAADKRARNERIRREFCGPDSLPEIQRWSGLSRTSIYRIVGGK